MWMSSFACEVRHSDPSARSADAILLAKGDRIILNVSFSPVDVVGTIVRLSEVRFSGPRG